jgi:hypothetical protein
MDPMGVAVGGDAIFVGTEQEIYHGRNDQHQCQLTDRATQSGR